MKVKHLLILAAALSFLAAGCKEPQPTPTPTPQPEKTLTVAPTTLNFETAGATKKVTVTTEDTWEATASATWIELKVESKTSLAVTVKENVAEAGKAAAAREGTITVKTAGGKTASVAVTQDAESIIFTVVGGTAEIAAEGGPLEVKVDHNVDYQVAVGADWIEEATTKAVATDTRKFTVKANTGDARQGEITFTPAGGTAQKVTVKQAEYVAPEIPGIQGTVTLTFPAKEQDAVSAYTKTWKAVNEQGAEFSIANFNNNNSAWAYIKGGNKTDVSVATISTVSRLDSKILHVAVTVDAVTAASINKTELITASDPEFTKVVETVALDPAKGTMGYVLTKPAEKLYYKLSYDCQKGSANGLIQISKVVYSTETYTPPTPPAPQPKSFADIIKAGAGDYLSNEALVVAVGSTNTIVTDGTGYMFIYDKNKVCKAGDKVVLEGAVTTYNGCPEWNNPTITVKSSGNTVTHPQAKVFDEAAFAAYASAPEIAYVTAKGPKTGYILKVGDNEINVYSNETIADGDYEITGYTIGYNSGKKQVNLVCTEYKAAGTDPGTDSGIEDLSEGETFTW